MSDKPNNKYTIEVKIPKPTDDDLRWAQELEKSFFKGCSKKMTDSVVKGNLWRVDYLLTNYEEKMDISQSDVQYMYFPPVLSALDKGHDQVAARLLIACSDFGTQTQKVFRSLIISNKLVFAELAIKSMGCKDDMFRYAIEKGYEQSVAAFLDAGMDVNDPEIEPLMLAVRFGSLTVVESLIEHGADIKSDPKSILLEAKRHAHYEVAGYLEKVLDIQEMEKHDGAWSKVSQQEIIYRHVSGDGAFTLTEAFNFESQTVMKVQYNHDQDLPPASAIVGFSTYHNENYLQKAFDALVEQGGAPDPIQSVKRPKSSMSLPSPKSDR